ncbi:hypothetical protein bcgnr5385_62050 [Bacillus cereus]
MIQIIHIVNITRLEERLGLSSTLSTTSKNKASNAAGTAPKIISA